MTKQATKKKKYNTYAKLGSHLGHKLGKKAPTPHPFMNAFLVGHRKKISLINMGVTLKYLGNALSFIHTLVKTNGHLLVVNTNPEFSNLVQGLLKKTKSTHLISYCNSKWLGGTLTNWKQVKKSVLPFARFSQRFGNFLLENKIHIPRYKKIKKCLHGFISEKRAGSPHPKPNMLFIINPNENQTVLQEATCLKIPIIAITDSKTKLSGITYPIPANNNSPFFVFFCLSWIIHVVLSADKIQ